MHSLELNNFLGLSDVRIGIDGLTIIIGPQASGKSILARLFFFFNEYLADFSGLPVASNEHKKVYDKRKKEEFYQIFPQYSWEAEGFEIFYENEDHSITISSLPNSGAIEISTSKSVSEMFRGLKKTYKDIYADLELSGATSRTKALLEYNRSISSRSTTNRSSLFVPAARSFYATIRDEIFSLLAMDSKIDKIILQFGEFYEAAKRGSFPRDRSEERFFNSIVRGRYERHQGRDWLSTPRGRVELSRASSGQQEAVPLLFAISRFPRPGRTLLIEEPEAHLFPFSQVSVLRFIVQQCVSHKTDILFTTHSPYMLSALNNEIAKNIYRRGGISPEMVKAYAIKDGDVRSIVDPETRLVDSSYIDEVSSRIADQFVRIVSDEN